MNELFELYLRYNGPLPKEERYHFSPISWNLLMRQYLRSVRLGRHQARHEADFDRLAALRPVIHQIHRALIS